MNAQSIVVKGNVLGSTTPIARASIIIIDKSDTTNQVSTFTDASGNYTINLITSIESSESIPTEFALEQNYPNPFSSSTSISYKLNQQSDVLLTVYDALGREVRKFNVGNQSVGVHGINWDAKNNFGVKLASGVYFYRMQVGSKSLTRKMILGNSLNNNYPLSTSFSMHTENSLKIENKFLGKKVIKLELTTVRGQLP